MRSIYWDDKLQKYWWSVKLREEKKVCNELVQLIKYLSGHSFTVRDVHQPSSAGNRAEDAKEKSDGNNSAVTRAGGFHSSTLTVKYQKPVCKSSSTKKGYLIQEYLKAAEQFYGYESLKHNMSVLKNSNKITKTCCNLLLA